MGKLAGKIALITGGNSGIGLATAKQFVNEGAYVFITGRRDPELVAAVKRGCEAGPLRRDPLLPNGASIILNASIVASKGFAANSVYSATKAAVRSFARTWKDRHIRVNAVSPGFIDTPGLSELLASPQTGPQSWQTMISGTVPLGRLGTPDEIAKAVVFLASDDSSYVTGTELFLDGGVAQV